MTIRTNAENTKQLFKLSYIENRIILAHILKTQKDFLAKVDYEMDTIMELIEDNNVSLDLFRFYIKNI